MNDKFFEWLKNLKDEDFESIAKDIQKQEDLKHESLKLFYKSDRFKEVIQEMKDFLKEHTQACDNLYSEFVFSNVTNDEFIYVFEIIFNPVFMNLDVSHENDNPFETEVVIFEGMKFVQMYGQGTAFIIKRME